MSLLQKNKNSSLLNYEIKLVNQWLDLKV